MEPKDFSAGSWQRVSWAAPSNIALVKYWGKLAGQLPCNPSISMTLQKAVTRTTVHYQTMAEEGPVWDFRFEGRRETSFEEKIKAYFDQVKFKIPNLVNLRMHIESENTFPHSSGIASSASAMAALSLCLLSIEEELSGHDLPMQDLLLKASGLARLGSGSAARSLFPGYVLWGENDSIPGSGNLHGVPLEEVHPFFTALNDAILIVSSRRKRVSSSAGHALMNQHPFALSRYEQASQHVNELIRILAEGDKENFIRIVENEALTLHSLMMSSDPAFLLLEPGTLEIIRKVWAYREQSGQFIAFTLDAGPNIHLLYHDINKHETEQFIEKELMKFCENEVFITDRMGTGPFKNQEKDQ